jgi:hypothetical protein
VYGKLGLGGIQVNSCWLKSAVSASEAVGHNDKIVSAEIFSYSKFRSEFSICLKDFTESGIHEAANHF